MYPDPYTFFEFPEIAAQDTGFLSVFLVVYLIAMLFAMGYSILVYILQSLGFYTIANRRGIHHPWMAWLPIVNMWILGSIADQYRYVAKGQVKSRRKTLVGLMIALYVLLFVMLGSMIALLITGIGSEFDMAISDAGMAVPLIIFAVSYVAMMVVAIVTTVYQYICLYDLFCSCNPNNAVAFLVLSIFFNFLLPYFVFACRKKDLGMPPRKIQVPVAPWQPAPAPAQPVWQNAVAPQPVSPVVEPVAEQEPETQEVQPVEEEHPAEE